MYPLGIQAQARVPDNLPPYTAVGDEIGVGHHHQYGERFDLEWAPHSLTSAES